MYRLPFDLAVRFWKVYSLRFDKRDLADERNGESRALIPPEMVSTQVYEYPRGSVNYSLFKWFHLSPIPLERRDRAAR